MAKVQYEKVSNVEPARGVAYAEEPRRFHSHFCNCFGNCDGIGWSSCCLVYWCPCIAFGMNVAKVTGNTCRAISCALLLLIAIVGVRGSSNAYQYLTADNPCTDQDTTSELCTEADLEELGRAAVRCGIVFLLSFVGLVTIGIVNRKHMRRALNVKYDVDGGCAECCDDTCAWCCFPLGLCQETRTLLHNRVDYGEWKGPLTMEHTFV